MDNRQLALAIPSSARFCAVKTYRKLYPSIRVNQHSTQTTNRVNGVIHYKLTPGGHPACIWDPATIRSFTVNLYFTYLLTYLLLNCCRSEAAWRTSLSSAHLRQFDVSSDGSVTTWRIAKQSAYAEKAWMRWMHPYYDLSRCVVIAHAA